MLVGDVGDPYFAEIVHGIYDVAVSANLLVTICSTERNVARELEYFRMLQANRTEIVILAGSGLGDPAYQKGIAARTKSFLASGGRAVSLGDPGTGVSRVLTDNVLGGELLGRHLADLGHQEIAVLAGDPRVRSTIDRLEGLRRGLPGAVHVLHGEQSRAGGMAMAAEALRDHPEVTALVGSADQMAIGALRLLTESGVSVPDAMSVAGFNDIEAAADVGLTTVRLPLRAMGSTAMRLALAGRVERELREEHLPVDLVVRSTTSRRRFCPE